MKTSASTRPKAFIAHSRRSWSEAEGGAPPLTSLRHERRASVTEHERVHQQCHSRQSWSEAESGSP